jgi:ribose 5-phosphate isomerase A
MVRYYAAEGLGRINSCELVVLGAGGHQFESGRPDSRWFSLGTRVGHFVVTTDKDSSKLRAALAAAALVESGMVVGLGSGTTAVLMVRRLGERVEQEGLKIIGVATSETTAELARQWNIPLRELDDVAALDINLDGADEINAQFQMIKGRGGALLREKIVASAANHRVTMITADKRVDRLGTTMPLPVEVSLFGVEHIERRIQQLGASTTRRRLPDGSPYVTDGGNAIIDCHFTNIDDPAALDPELQSMAGVLETGLFLNLCDTLIVGINDTFEQIESGVRNRA